MHETGQVVTVRNISRLCASKLDNIIYDALLPVEERERLDIFDEVCFNTESLPKIFPLDSSTAKLIVGRAIAEVVSHWRPRFDPRSGQVGFVVDKVALGQVFSAYFGFPCQSSFHQILHHHNHRYNRPFSG
jgi:hypothetical protein